jgi:hypothetical protein
LMMEAVSISETSVSFCETTRRNNQEDSHLEVLTITLYIIDIITVDNLWCIAGDFSSYYPFVCWHKWRKTTKTSVGIAGNPAELGTFPMQYGAWPLIRHLGGKQAVWVTFVLCPMVAVGCCEDISDNCCLHLQSGTYGKQIIFITTVKGPRLCMCVVFGQENKKLWRLR